MKPLKPRVLRGVSKTGPSALRQLFTAPARCVKMRFDKAKLMIDEIGRKALAIAARAVLDVRLGRALTDTEWDRAKARLIDFVALVRCWEQPGGINDSVPCQPLAA